MTDMPHPKKEEQTMDRRTFYCDVDDTLLMHDLSAYSGRGQLNIKCNGREFVGVPNWKNTNLLIKFYKLGYEVVVWSKTGKSWAKAVGVELGIDKYIDHYMTKPDFICDDREPSEWLGPNT